MAARALAGGADLQAARALFRAAQSTGSAIISSSSCSSSVSSTMRSATSFAAVSTSSLKEARSLYSSFVGTTASETMKLPLPSSIFGASAAGSVSDSASSAALGRSLVNAGSGLWQNLMSLVKTVGGRLALVLRYVAANPRVLLGGGLAVSVIAGIGYLIVNRDVFYPALTGGDTPPASVATRSSNTDAQVPSATASFSVEDAVAAPPHLCCPVTCLPFVDPVTISSGHSFERAAIQHWFANGNSTCPLTRLECDVAAMVPNLNLRDAVAEWAAQQQLNQE